jgi:hypothetical protein
VYALILLQGFKTIISMKLEEKPTKCRNFLTNSKNSKTNPRLPSNIHPKQEKSLQEVCTTLAPQYTKRKHHNIVAQERDDPNFPSRVQISAK